MGLLDIFRSKPRVSVSPPPSGSVAPRRYATDRARMFDLNDTQRLDALFRMPAAERGDAWIARFYQSAWTASVSVPEPAYFRYRRI